MYQTPFGYLDVFSGSGMWKVSGDVLQSFRPDSQAYRQEIMSKITHAVESTAPLTWDQVRAVAGIRMPAKIISLIRERGVGFVMTQEMRQEIFYPEIVRAIEARSQ